MSILAQSQPSRQGYVSAVQLVGAGIVPSAAGEVQPSFFTLAAITGFRAVRGGGVWLNCQFHYNKPAGMVYHIEAACHFDYVAKSTGRVFVRSCSCPDGLMRRGQKGELRQCKHMVALAARIAASAGAAAGAALVERVQQPPVAEVFAVPVASAAPAVFQKPQVVYSECSAYDNWLGQSMEDERAAGACE